MREKFNESCYDKKNELFDIEEWDAQSREKFETEGSHKFPTGVTALGYSFVHKRSEKRKNYCMVSGTKDVLGCDMRSEKYGTRDKAIYKTSCVFTEMMRSASSFKNVTVPVKADDGGFVDRTLHNVCKDNIAR